MRKHEDTDLKAQREQQDAEERRKRRAEAMRQRWIENLRIEEQD